MSADLLATIAQDLSSLDHAILLSLIAKQHCLIETERSALDDVTQEIQLITGQLFGLACAVVDCHRTTTLEDFSRSILIAAEDEDDHVSPVASHAPRNNRQASSYSISKPQSHIDYNIANIVIAKDLGSASRQVQVQALELLRTNRIFTHTSVHSAPKPFLLVIVAPTDAEPLNIHLNDIIFLSHYHNPLDELPRRESVSARRLSAPSSSAYISRQTVSGERSDHAPAIPVGSLLEFSNLLPSIDLTAETRSYLMTLAICIRTHRALIPGSATPLATQYLELLSRCLALLHGVDYISPSIVALATRKVYRHRLQILEPSQAAWERSVMYGSKVADVKELLDDLWTDERGTPKRVGEVAEGIIEDVVSGVEIPV